MKKLGTTLALVGIVLLSSLIYWLVFTRPAGFLTLASRSKVYQENLYESPPGVRWLLIASFLALAGVLLLAWNPVVLYEAWGNGHNDIIMVFWVLLAAGLIAWRQLPDMRSRQRYLLASAAGGALLVLLAYWPLWQGTQVLSFTRRLDLFTTSLPAVIYQLSIPRLGETRAASLISDIALLLTFAFALWQGWRAARNPSPDFGRGE